MNRVELKTRHDQMRERCEEFHARNRAVWDLFLRFAFERIRQGFEHYSVNGIFERIRWETDEARMRGKVEWKLNNNYRAFYARRFMAIYPQYGEFFRTRRQTSRAKLASDRPELTAEDFE